MIKYYNPSETTKALESFVGINSNAQVTCNTGTLKTGRFS